MGSGFFFPVPFSVPETPPAASGARVGVSNSTKRLSIFPAPPTHPRKATLGFAHRAFPREEGEVTLRAGVSSDSSKTEFRSFLCEGVESIYSALAMNAR